LARRSAASWACGSTRPASVSPSAVAIAATICGAVSTAASGTNDAPSWNAQRYQSCCRVLEQLFDLRQLGFTAHQPRRLRGYADRRGRRSGRQHTATDALVQRRRFAGRLHAKLGGEGTATPLVLHERLAATAVASQKAHQRTIRFFIPRFQLDQPPGSA
jgi:hypothetical protein